MNAPKELAVIIGSDGDDLTGQVKLFGLFLGRFFALFPSLLFFPFFFF
jgi:hypothetical protein